MSNKISNGLPTPENIIVEARKFLKEVDVDLVLLQERMAKIYLLERILPYNLISIFKQMPDTESTALFQRTLRPFKKR